jgi:protein tyrosine phosphatase (PTP) superfamily phosphohydrolase (DUF442 family)
LTPKKHEKTKFIRFLYLAILPAILIVSTSAYFVGEYGLPFGSHFTNDQRHAATIAEQEKWAERIELTGLPNFYKVSNELYRGAQPTADGMKQLEKLGVKTVINLRSIHSDSNEIKGTDLSYVHIGMTAWRINDNDVIRLLRVITDKTRTPVFVHCQHGSDRTGTMCAIYRIAVQGWSKDEAIEEMTKGGFGFNRIWRNLPKYIRNLNVQEIKQKASLRQ